MTIRCRALAWLRSRGLTDGHVVTSKFYIPEESWTGDNAWWFQIPERALQSEQFVDLVCEASPGSLEFRHLRVPSEFFRAHWNEFALVAGDKINLFLSARAANIFEDQRGDGQIQFARFEDRPRRR